MIEVMVASMVVLIAGGGIFWVGIETARIGQTNRLATQARGLAIQRLEEVCASGIEDVITVNGQYAVYTNEVQGPYEVIRTVEVVGHAADKSVASNLADSVYLEIHVDVTYNIPGKATLRSDTYSMIVR